MKKIYLVILTVLMLFSFILPASALTVSDTYSDVASTSSQANNLINLAASYDDFIESKYVVFCDVQYSYYIVWGDLQVENGIVSGADIQYIRYYRTGTTSSYTYEYGTDVSFGLNPDHICTSNLSEFGFKSAVYSEYELFDDIEKFLVFMTAFLFIITIIKLRGNK